MSLQAPAVRAATMEAFVLEHLAAAPSPTLHDPFPLPRSVAHTLEERLVPERIDLSTGEIACRPDPIHIFRQAWTELQAGAQAEGGWEPALHACCCVLARRVRCTQPLFAVHLRLHLPARSCCAGSRLTRRMCGT